jgi:tetratricopeptide (TPR) repeat protein
LQELVRQAQADLRCVRELDRIRLDAAADTTGPFRVRLGRAACPPAYAAAFRQYGIDFDRPDKAALAAQVKASPVKASLLAALDDWALWEKDQTRQARLLAVARRVDPDPWRDLFRNPAVWKDRRKLQDLARQADVGQLSPAILTSLAHVLRKSGANPIPYLRKAQARHPRDFWLNFELGCALYWRGAAFWPEAAGYFGLALVARPDTPLALTNQLLCILQRDPHAALALARRAVAIEPKDWRGHYNLAVCLSVGLGDWAGAEAAIRQALKLKPNLAAAHQCLGNLWSEIEPTRALEAYQKAVELAPHDQELHKALGRFLVRQQQMDPKFVVPDTYDCHYAIGLIRLDAKDYAGALTSFERALAKKPGDSRAWLQIGNSHLGNGEYEAAGSAFKAVLADPGDVADKKEVTSTALHGLVQLAAVQDKLDELIPALRRITELLPDNPGFAFHVLTNYYNQALRTGKRDALIKVGKAAVDLFPNYAPAYVILGAARNFDQDYPGALEAFRTAVELDPDNAEAQFLLGLVLTQLGRYREAHPALSKADQLGQLTPGWRYPSGQLLQQCRMMNRFEARLPAVLEGRLKPADGNQAINYAFLCLHRERFAKAAELYAEGFAANPKLAGQSRTLAAQAAAQAGCGRGKDAAGLKEPERVRLRGQALAWLREEFEAQAGILDNGPPAARGQALSLLRSMLRQPHFDAVRSPEALARLPEVEAREWAAFWERVRQRVKSAGGQVPP